MLNLESHTIITEAQAKGKCFSNYADAQIIAEVICERLTERLEPILNKFADAVIDAKSEAEVLRVKANVRGDFMRELSVL